MDQFNESCDYEVLGFNVKFKPESGKPSTEARDIVEFVNKEAFQIKDQYPSLDNGQVAILLALKLAKENMKLNKEYKENIYQLQKSAMDALQTMDEITPFLS